MSTARQTVTVSILDKDYSILCDADESDSLQAAARHLDFKMQAIRSGGKVVGLERVAIMAALNITHEFLRSEGESNTDNQSVQGEIDRLTGVIESALL